MEKVYDNMKGEFPPNVPAKLIKLFKSKKCNYRATARALSTRNFEMNPKHVNVLLRKGEEPRDRNIRLKLFLKGKYRIPIPKWVKDGVLILADLEKKAIEKKSV